MPRKTDITRILLGWVTATMTCMALLGGSAIMGHAQAEEGEGGQEKKPRLIRVVDLPDVPALHWRGGRFKDLGYLFDEEGGGTWVAYLGPDHYLPLTQRELESMLRIAAAYGRPVGDIPQERLAKTEGELPVPAASAHGGNDVAASNEGTVDKPSAAGKSDLAMDTLDRALLPTGEADLLTGSTTPAPQTATENVAATEEAVGPGPRMPAANGANGGTRPAGSKEGGLLWGWLAALVFLIAGVTGTGWMLSQPPKGGRLAVFSIAGVTGAMKMFMKMFRGRRQASRSLRERMHHVMRSMPSAAAVSTSADEGFDGQEDRKAMRKGMREGMSAQERGARPSHQSRKESRKAGMIRPDEALRAMQAAARGGLAT